MRSTSLVVLLVLGVAACSRPGAATRVDLSTLDGARITEDTLAGKLVLVNFWATWCAPCREEMPALQAVYRRHVDNGLVVLGLISGDPADDDEVQSVARSRGVTYPLARSTPALEARYGMGAMLPTSVLFDRAGRVRARWNGVVTEEELEVKVREALAR
jgi:thiol-disulfide isomerase/thioredoxin